ncbi:MSHA biogenesis protein MshE [Methylomonas methanica]|uniref:MSHA biogenesis protein MshE n=1 Tax=Methylomonas methanica TaxID=421 RepID=A0A177MBH0_METMH|nr:GspE/PulE family protein [Methylomonas methanica]OAI03032.1 MSHA biogenesis protein MshE [Methylomonas methanica]
MEYPQKKIRIGDLLVQHRIISHEQLMTALAEQKKTGRKLGRTLVDLNYISETDLLSFLSRQLQIPFLDISQYKRKPEICKELPENLARRFRVMLLESNANDVLLAMADPTDLMGLDELSRVLKKRIRQAVVRESDLLTAIDQAYRRTEEISNLADQLSDELAENQFDLNALLSSSEVSDAPVVKLLQSIFEDAVQTNASDIHIEPDENVLRIRQRVDGVLNEQVLDNINIAPALMVRLKLMCGLNISEKRLPQDGRFSIRVKNKALDVRLSTLPIQSGESVVMRILDQSKGLLDLELLGMPAELLSRFKSHIRNPHGLILVTGPTGSGKTTTLYAALSSVNYPQTKIITAEDPVEYSLPRINQAQVNDKIGLTFASVLRSALRQDPDVILVGEIRDRETAEIAVRASITGHLVFSTLHTNGAVETATRLLDMGIEGYILASALKVIVAQRLVRKICDRCAQAAEINEGQSIWLEKTFNLRAGDIVFKKGAGCQYCNHVGYRGRIGVYELLELNHDTLDALRRNDSAGFISAARATPGFKPFTAQALELVKQGTTTLHEIMRISES